MKCSNTATPAIMTTIIMKLQAFDFHYTILIPEECMVMKYIVGEGLQNGNNNANNDNSNTQQQPQ
jgi:cytochrome bd-type quinol oxidase subunit 1